MKIALAQITSYKGNIQENIEKHCMFIDRAITQGADAIFFPELSITGYEPELATELATTQSDERFNTFQLLSDKHNITIGIGAPLKGEKETHISLIVFQPKVARQTYAKQHLHTDELPYFVPGDHQLMLTIANRKIVPAICYESLLEEHSEKAVQKGAEIYLASVAKPKGGVEKAYGHFPGIAKKYSMPVLMVNSIGYCDNFLGYGSSAIWNEQGKLVAKLDTLEEDILMFDFASITNPIIE